MSKNPTDDWMVWVLLNNLRELHGGPRQGDEDFARSMIAWRRQVIDAGGTHDEWHESFMREMRAAQAEARAAEAELARQGGELLRSIGIGGQEP